jgi:hypothetical protein
MRHVRTLCGVLFAVVVLSTLAARPSEARTSHAAKKPCAANLAACGDQGCGTDFDPNLNKLKNISTLDGTPTSMTLTSMMSLEDPVAFTKGGSRDDLAKIGEGKPVVVVAYLLIAKPELGGESCNCGLQTAPETDNHLVLVNKNTLLKFPVQVDQTDGAAKEDLATFHSREPESLTAEFTPRVRLQHPNYTAEKVKPLIDAADQEALLVRVTGQLLFDSEHFLGHHLVRVNNWEVHPVFKLEYCPSGACTAASNDGWKSLDDL